MADNVTPIDPAVRIGHVHLVAADLERRHSLLLRVLASELTQRYGRDRVLVGRRG